MKYVGLSWALLALVTVALSFGMGCGGGGNLAQATTAPLPTGNPASGQLSATPTRLNFGSVLVENTASQSVRLSNSGGTTVTVSSASTSGPGFSVGGLSLPADIAPGQSLTFIVAFGPGNSGAASGTVQLTNSAASPLSIALSGTGTAAVAHSVDASWSASISAVSGYNVYRSNQSGGPFTKINQTLIADTFFTDLSVSAGATYFYVVTAVNASNTESAYSTEAKAVVPAP